MTRNFSCITAALLLVLLTSCPAFSWQAVVVKIIDGDSLKVRRGDRIIEMRLYGIDTPEYRQPYSNRAKRFLRQLVDHRVVEVTVKDMDRYGRTVALVSLEGRIINVELVRNGLAWFYPRYCQEQPVCGEIESLQKEAARQKLGLWRDENPISPWEWKRRVREKQSESGAAGYKGLPDRF